MMKFGMIGLGKMGMNLVKNAVDHEIEVVAYDLNTKAVEEAKDYSDNITAVSTIENLLTELPARKIVWLMLPAGTPTNSTIAMLSEKLSAGDILIDGGNSNYKDNLEQNKLLTENFIMEKTYHFTGIKGSGMSALALMLHQIGKKVQGSDSTDYFFTQRGLEQANVPLY